MAQSIILKRSAVSGKVPTTSSLAVGEIAINTYDGRVFLHVSKSSSESIEHIVTTNTITTGSIYITLTGSFTELEVSNDANIKQDLYVTRDIITNGDLDILGTFTASLQQGYIWVGNGGSTTKIIPTGSLITNFAVSSSYPFKVVDSGLFSNGITDISQISTTETVIIGLNAGEQASMADGAVFVGTRAGYTATAAQYSAFLGYDAGNGATGAESSVFVGYEAGKYATHASQSVLIGYAVGKKITGAGIGGNNIIIGNNITLPNGTNDSLNIGGVIFASGLNADISGDPIIKPVGNAKVGINKSNPSHALDVSGSGNFSNCLVVTGSFTASLQEGYAWVGNGNGKTKAVATASFGSSIDITSLNSFTQSYYTDSSSFDSRISGITVGSAPPGTISGSAQITSFGFVSGSYETTGRGIVSSSYQIDFTQTINWESGVKGVLNTNTVISGSSQLTPTFDTRYELQGTGILSSSNQTFSNFTSSVNFRLDSIENITSSYELKGTGILSSSNITFAEYTSSIEILTGSIINRLDNIELVSGTFATTGSNTFYGNQTISGSVTITQDFIVLGSSSILNISSSTLDIGTNIIRVNTSTETLRFGGLEIIDSGSTPVGSGSLLYDSLQDEFVFVHKGNGTNVTSSHFIMGPETFDDLGNELYITKDRLPKGLGNEHIVDSTITDDGTNVSIGVNLIVTGSFTASLEEGYVWVGTDGGNSLTTLATASFSALKTKAGGISGSAFTGVLRKSTVTFTTPFPNNQYAVTVTGEDARVFTIENKTSGSFTINTNTRAPMGGITYWIATSYGEMA